MKRLAALLLAGVMALGLVGCGGSWTTEERDGYSFDINTSWEKERYDEDTYYYSLEGGSVTEALAASEEGVDVGPLTTIRVSEYKSSYAYETFEKQSESFERMLEGHTSENGISGWRYSDVKMGSLGAYASVTYIQTFFYDGEDMSSSQGMEFFVSPNLKVTISFSCPLERVSKYQADFDKVINSVKLI
jgi:hypothetical protein